MINWRHVSFGETTILTFDGEERSIAKTVVLRRASEPKCARTLL